MLHTILMRSIMLCPWIVFCGWLVALTWWVVPSAPLSHVQAGVEMLPLGGGSGGEWIDCGSERGLVGRCLFHKIISNIISKSIQCSKQEIQKLKGQGFEAYLQVCNTTGFPFKCALLLHRTHLSKIDRTNVILVWFSNLQGLLTNYKAPLINFRTHYS